MVVEDVIKEIQDAIDKKREELQTHYETLEEVDSYGWEVVFTANTEDETIQSAFNSGRAIGELEGEISSLQNVLNNLYFELSKKGDGENE
jgi:hypothetical protein